MTDDILEVQSALRNIEQLGEQFLDVRKQVCSQKLAQVELEQRAAEVRREEKRLVSLLAAKGAAPGSLGPGTLEALLRLKG
ncbi:hypothetical protein HaLaN_14293 [Haematococcus lacustris]|uniref:Uncharacterized protein n=1 Tax=Haematococcus lacustris TaxID=44745 RepID=A0A699Z4Y3_HAELA|nr:hypothetical protein HaLaN_14293 [Haematococcus lacustris]